MTASSLTTKGLSVPNHSSSHFLKMHPSPGVGVGKGVGDGVGVWKLAAFFMIFYRDFFFVS